MKQEELSQRLYCEKPLELGFLSQKTYFDEILAISVDPKLKLFPDGRDNMGGHWYYFFKGTRVKPIHLLDPKLRDKLERALFSWRSANDKFWVLSDELGMEKGKVILNNGIIYKRKDIHLIPAGVSFVEYLGQVTDDKEVEKGRALVNTYHRREALFQAIKVYERLLREKKLWKL